jgi:hypothetical protein
MRSGIAAGPAQRDTQRPDASQVNSFPFHETTMKMNRVITAALLSVSLAAPALAFADTVDLKADLLTSTEVQPKAGDGHGELTATYDTASKVLQWKVTYADLSGPASMAHFHGPAPAGKNAGVVIPMNELLTPIEGQATLSAAQESDLLAGNWYFNLHTAKNPGGEIRGQVEQVQ